MKGVWSALSQARTRREREQVWGPLLFFFFFSGFGCGVCHDAHFCCLDFHSLFLMHSRCSLSRARALTRALQKGVGGGGRGDGAGGGVAQGWEVAAGWLEESPLCRTTLPSSHLSCCGAPPSSDQVGHVGRLCGGEVEKRHEREWKAEGRAPATPPHHSSPSASTPPRHASISKSTSGAPAAPPPIAHHLRNAGPVVGLNVAQGGHVLRADQVDGDALRKKRKVKQGKKKKKKKGGCVEREKDPRPRTIPNSLNAPSAQTGRCAQCGASKAPAEGAGHS